MTVQIKAPAMGESIAEAVVAKWVKAEGDFVAADEMVAELETDKVNLEVTAPKAGRLTRIVAAKDATVKVGDVMGEIDESISETRNQKPETRDQKPEGGVGGGVPVSAASADERVAKSGPAVQKLVAESGKDVSGIQGSGKGGRLVKGDLLQKPETRDQKPEGGVGGGAPASVTTVAKVAVAAGGEERVPMTRIRKTIASRLKQAQNTAAMLTTYNEVDLQRVGELRKQFKDVFEKKHGAKLGYMGFFTKAVVQALHEFPALNAEVDGEEIIYKHHYDIGIAVSGEKGLVVPVVRGADAKDLAGIEKDIADFGGRARNGGLKPDELVGATFSITNGGVFGSMMSMPILNYPQVGILGMHAIKERPVVVNGEIVIRPMMYLALTYDHRIVDGREAVGFLVRVKECLEEPGRLVLGV